MRYVQAQAVTATTGVNYIFLEVPRGAILLMVNMNNRNYGYVVRGSISLTRTDNPNDQSAFALIHSVPLKPYKDIHWEGRIELKNPDDFRFIRGFFDGCVAGNVLNMSMGLE